MNSNDRIAKNSPKFLGTMFLIIIVTSLVSGILVKLSGGISDILITISNNLALSRVSVSFGLLTSVGIVALGVLLYTVLKDQNKTIARIALGWKLIEAIFVAISFVGLLALIPLSKEFMTAGAPANSFYQTLGNFIYSGIYKQAGTIDMLFYCIGGLIWYYLFYKSRYIPRGISVFGLISVIIALAGIILELFGHSVSMFVYLPLLPFELIIGFWLLVKGINQSEAK